jgi:Na+/H+ antiporter NhaD/arsenite permease-like protein
MVLPFSPPPEFLIFGATLLGVAVGHRHALWIALAGLVATVAYKLAFTGFAAGPGVLGLAAHFGQEWVTLANLMLLLVGFAILAHHFEASNLPHAIPRFLPSGWAGGVTLLALVFVLSAFLDNIAGAVIGGVVAKHVYQGRVGVGYVASLVAASNAGGAGSVVGDTTTTMVWLAGASPLHVLPAYVASASALCIFAGFGAWSQHRFAPIERHTGVALRVDWSRVAIVGAVLVTIIGANVATNLLMPELEGAIPVLGIAIWIALLAGLIARRPDWSIAPAAAKGGLFLISLVAIASLMPVERLPAASWATTFGLGVLSSVFDNIPLTALALQQGGYDWALLAYAVGFGGSMIWFGSSAGVALTGLFPEGRSIWAWLRQGWHIPVAYAVGFLVYLAAIGYQPEVLPNVPGHG